MRRTASDILNGLEMRVARLEKLSNFSLGAVAFGVIKKFRKSLNRKLSKYGIEIQPTLPRAGNFFIKVEGVSGLLEVREPMSETMKNSLVITYKEVKGPVIKDSWFIDVSNFVLPKKDDSSLWSIHDWLLDSDVFIDEILSISGSLMKIGKRANIQKRSYLFFKLLDHLGVDSKDVVEVVEKVDKNVHKDGYSVYILIDKSLMLKNYMLRQGLAWGISLPSYDYWKGEPMVDWGGKSGEIISDGKERLMVYSLTLGEMRSLFKDSPF